MFEVGDLVLIKIALMKGVMRFRKKGKLSPKNVGLYMVIEPISNVVWKLELPQEMTSVHNIFHVTMLKKYFPDPYHIIQP